MKIRPFVYLYALGTSFVVGLGLCCVLFGIWHGVHDVARLVSTAPDIPSMKRHDDVQALPELAYKIRCATDSWSETSSYAMRAVTWPIKKVVEHASLAVEDAAQKSPDKVEEARRMLGRIAWLLNSVEPDRWKNDPLYQRICANSLPTSPKVGWIIAGVILWHLATLGSFAIVGLQLRAKLRTLYGRSPQPVSMGDGTARTTVKRLSSNPRLTLETGWRAFFSRKLFHSQSHRSSMKPTQMLSSPIIRTLTGTYWLTEACLPAGSEILIGGAQSSDETLEIIVPSGEYIYVKPTALIGYMVRDNGRPFTLLSGLFKNFWWGIGSNPPMLFTGPCKVYLRAHALDSLDAKYCEAVPAHQLLWFSLAKPPTLVNSRPDSDIGSLLHMGLFLRHDPAADEALWVDRRMLPGSLRILGKLIHLLIFFPIIAWVVVAF